MGSLREATVKGILWLFSGRVLQHVVNLLSLPILARLLTPAEFGVMSAALLVIDFSNSVSMLGLSPSIVQKLELDRRHVQTANTSGLVLGCLFTLIIYLSAPLVERIFQMDGLKEVVQIMSGVFIIYGIGMTPTALMRRNMRFKQISFIPWTTKIVYAVVSIVLAILGWGVFALVAGRVATALANNLIYVVLQPVKPTFYFSKSAFNDLFKFGSGMSLSMIVNYFGRQGDFLLVGTFFGSVALGLYSRAYRLMNLPVAFIGQTLVNVLLPAMSKVQNNNETMRRTFAEGNIALMFVVLPLSAFSAIMSSEIVIVLLGSQWLEAIPLFRILSLAMFFRVAYKVSISMIAAKGHSYDVFVRQIIFSVVVLGTVYLGTSFGLEGVAWAMTFSLVAMYFLMAQGALKQIEMRWPEFLGKHYRPLLISVAIGLVTYLINTGLHQMHLPTFWRLAVVSIVVGGGWLLVLMRFPVLLGEHMMRVLKTARNSLKHAV